MIRLGSRQVLRCSALALTGQLLACGSGSTSSAQAEPGPASSSGAMAQSTAPGSCGQEGLPDCPTQRWMKATLQTYLRTGDYARLEKALQTLAAAAPAGYAGWQETSRKASLAAHSHDARAVKEQCSACHEQHRKRFRSERRLVPLALVAQESP